MATLSVQDSPTSEIDLFSQEHVENPFPVLDMLREKGSVVYMARHDFWLLTRYTSVKAATQDWQKLTSRHGVGLFPPHNENIAGTILGSDPPEHDRLRATLAEKLTPRALRHLGGDIRAKAETLVSDVLVSDAFDGMTDIAKIFPVNVVADLVGLPTEGREHLNPGADAIFTAFGPYTAVLEERMPTYGEYWQYMTAATTRENLTPGSWGAILLDAVDDGRLTVPDVLSTLGAYLTAGMDTTVNAIGALLQLFAQRPEIWRSIRDDPSLIAPVFEEILRMETPVQGFFRVTTQDTAVEDAVIPAGARVMLHWGAANRDPRYYPDPHDFKADRNPLDHLAFGSGPHACIGQGLARLEVTALVETLIPRVESFALSGEVVRHYNPVIRGLDSVPLTVVRAQP